MFPSRLTGRLDYVFNYFFFLVSLHEITNIFLLSVLKLIEKRVRIIMMVSDWVIF